MGTLRRGRVEEDFSVYMKEAEHETLLALRRKNRTLWQKFKAAVGLYEEERQQEDTRALECDECHTAVADGMMFTIVKGRMLCTACKPLVVERTIERVIERPVPEQPPRESRNVESISIYARRPFVTNFMRSNDLGSGPSMPSTGW